MKRFRQDSSLNQINLTQRSMLPALLVAGFALRLISGLYSHSIVHPDEVFQYLEQAYRTVHGYGLIPWEYQYGIRNWTIPLFLAGLLKLFSEVGWTTPPTYIPAVTTILCLVSLALPIGIFGMVGNLLGRRTATVALVLACFWPDFVYNASKPMPTVLATYCIVCAIWLATGPRSGSRLFAAGLLAGLALVIRYQLIPFIGLLGLWYIYRLGRLSTHMILGTICSVAMLGGLLDWVTWGGAFYSFIENFHLNFSPEVSNEFGTGPVLFYPISFAAYTFGLVVPAGIGLLSEWKRLLPYLITVTIGALFFYLPAHKLYRYLFWTIPFLLIGLACLFEKLRSDSHEWQLRYGISTRNLGTWVFVFITLNNLASLQLSPVTGYTFLARYGDQVQAMDEIAEMHGVTGIYASSGFFWWQTTGYYGLGKDIPVYFNGLDGNIRASGLRLLNAHVSHWLSTTRDAPQGWKLVDRIGRLMIFANPKPTTVKFPADWTFQVPIPSGVAHFLHPRIQTTSMLAAPLHSIF